MTRQPDTLTAALSAPSPLPRRRSSKARRRKLRGVDRCPCCGLELAVFRVGVSKCTCGAIISRPRYSPVCTATISRLCWQSVR